VLVHGEKSSHVAVAAAWLSTCDDERLVLLTR
jgi:hypothetical protein